MVALDSTLLGTIENNVSVRTSTPVGEITAEIIQQYAVELLTAQHEHLREVGVERAAHEAFRSLNETTYLNSYRHLMDDGDLSEEDLKAPLGTEYPFELTAESSTRRLRPPILKGPPNSSSWTCRFKLHPTFSRTSPSADGT